MKIRLKVQMPDGTTSTFEHAGPTIRIGRDPQCELYLQGKAAEVVSRTHARVELSSKGATVADAGSSNGTLVNGRLLTAASSLRVGDEIQLGQTGVTIRLVDIESEARKPLPIKPVLIGGGILSAVAVIGVVAFLIWNRPGTVAEHTSPESTHQGTTTPATTNQPVSTTPAVEPKTTKPNTPPRVETPPKVVPPKPRLAAEPVEVGTYVALPEWGPSVLLRREGEAFPWVPIPAEGRVSTEHTLVSLPGYRSSVSLDSGVWLTLWGHLPQFSTDRNTPRVFESIVVINKPTDNVDLEVTLDRGRIHMTNGKDKSARIRLNFLNEKWVVTLPPGKQSEVVVELWERPTPGVETGPSAFPWHLQLMTREGGRVEVSNGNRELKSMARLAFASQPNSLSPPEPLKELPDWWIKAPSPKSNLAVAAAMDALEDWSLTLSKSSDVIDDILTSVRAQASTADQRGIGVLFLGALDAVGPVVICLASPFSEVRGTAAGRLQAWLGRSAAHPDQLRQTLRDKLNFASGKADRVLELLQPLSQAKLSQAKTYEDLFKDLEHSDPVVRSLAFMVLRQVIPNLNATIRYDPDQDPAKQMDGIRQWKELGMKSLTESGTIQP